MLVARRSTRYKTRPIVAVTLGDAAGVGPELCLQLLNNKDLPGKAVPLVIGSSQVLSRVARTVNVPFEAPVLRELPQSLASPAVFDPLDELKADEIKPGCNQARCGLAAARYIEQAVRGCLERRFAAMVTAPISKKALNLAGVDFPGHTEMLAALTKTSSYAMLFHSPLLACAFVTCHQSLRSVPDALTVERVVEVAMLAWKNVTLINGRQPRLALLGLNPHAGEEGLFGAEEQRVLIPARKVLRQRGLDIEGPLPPDTAFAPAARERYGCYLGMYHDQISIPFKMLAFDAGVNVTMGLPIIRTSPDHGTAFDIAWRGKVNPDSFMAAVRLAIGIAGRKAAATRATRVRLLKKSL